MENYFAQNQNTGQEMIITNQAREFLKETSKWAKFLSILGFIMTVFMIMAGFMMGALMSTSFGSMMDTGGLPVWFLPVLYFILAALYVAPLYYLYQFSSKAKIALDSSDSNLMAESLGFLKSHYKYIGIMMIVILAIYAISIVIAIVAGLIGATALAGL